MIIPRSKIIGYENPELIYYLVQKNQDYRQQLLDFLLDASLMASLNSVLYAYLQKTTNDDFKILEIGAGAGHLAVTFFQLFPDLSISWQIIETDRLVREAKLSGFEEECLEFYSLDQFSQFPRQTYDLLIANSALQYISSPLDYLLNLVDSHTIRSIYIGKTPITDDATTITGIQYSRLTSNGPGLYLENKPLKRALDSSFNIKLVEYPIHTLSASQLLTILKDYQMAYEFLEGHIEIHLSCALTKAFLNHKFCSKVRIPTRSRFYMSRNSR